MFSDQEEHCHVGSPSVDTHLNQHSLINSDALIYHILVHLLEDQSGEDQVDGNSYYFVFVSTEDIEHRHHHCLVHQNVALIVSIRFGHSLSRSHSPVYNQQSRNGAEDEEKDNQ